MLFNYDNFINFRGDYRPDKGWERMEIPSVFFNEGQYFIDLMIIRKNDEGYFTFFNEPDILSIQILPEKRDLGTWMGKEEGFIRHSFNWNV